MSWTKPRNLVRTCRTVNLMLLGASLILTGCGGGRNRGQRAPAAGPQVTVNVPANPPQNAANVTSANPSKATTTASAGSTSATTKTSGATSVASTKPTSSTSGAQVAAAPVPGCGACAAGNCRVHVRIRVNGNVYVGGLPVDVPILDPVLPGPIALAPATSGISPTAPTTGSAVVAVKPPTSGSTGSSSTTTGSGTSAPTPNPPRN